MAAYVYQVCQPTEVGNCTEAESCAEAGKCAEAQSQVNINYEREQPEGMFSFLKAVQY